MDIDNRTEETSTHIRALFPTTTYQMRSRRGDHITVTKKYNQKLAAYVDHVIMECPTQLALDSVDEIPLFKF